LKRIDRDRLFVALIGEAMVDAEQTKLDKKGQ
jgi:hypothetical protein